MKVKSLCRSCGFSWKGYRVMPDKVFHNDGGGWDIVGYSKLKGPGMTVCPSCKSEYFIEWTNYENWAKWFARQSNKGR